MLIEDELERMHGQWEKLLVRVEKLPSDGMISQGADGDEEDSAYSADFRHAEVWEYIADQTVKIKLMVQSPHAAVHSDELAKHDDRLRLIGDLCELLHESQFGYLAARQHLLSEGGMMKDAMQKAGARELWKRFEGVDKQWQQIVAVLRGNPSWLTLLELPNLLESCRDTAGIMERIQRAVHDVLEQHRAQTPLMHRLDDEALLRVLQCGYDPTLPAVRRLFPGVFVLDCDGARKGTNGVSTNGVTTKFDVF